MACEIRCIGRNSNLLVCVFVYLLFILCCLLFICLLLSYSSMFRHYRVTQKPEGGFIIDLTDPVSIKM